MFLAVNMGASGTAPAFSAAYGANVIRQSMIPGLFGIMVLLGALLFGKQVSLTLGDGLLDHAYFTPFTTSVILFSIAASLLVANLLGVPQSTSQSTVFSIAGAATAVDSLNTEKLLRDIIPTWFILPLVAFVLVYVFFKWFIPWLKPYASKRLRNEAQDGVLMRGLLIVSSLYVAVSIGANNVANAAAPIAALTSNELGKGAEGNFLPILILSVLVVAPCFAIGSSLMGHKVTSTTGQGIVEVNTFEAAVIAFTIATLLLLASVTKGVPTSLVQLAGASFIALALVKNGRTALWTNPTVRKFFTVWAVAPVFAFVFSFLVLWFFVK
jgi:phosphate/sulfate permease